MPRLWLWLVPLLVALPSRLSAQEASVRVAAVLLRPADAGVSVSVREAPAGRALISVTAPDAPPAAAARRCEIPAPVAAVVQPTRGAGSEPAGREQRWLIGRGDGAPQRLTLRCARLRTDL